MKRAFGAKQPPWGDAGALMILSLPTFFSQDTRNAAPKYVSFLVRGFK
jgi:hypothetical protein